LHQFIHRIPDLFQVIYLPTFVAFRINPAI
jgi:hypothetical protein